MYMSWLLLSREVTVTVTSAEELCTPTENISNLLGEPVTSQAVPGCTYTYTHTYLGRIKGLLVTDEMRFGFTRSDGWIQRMI